MFDFENSAAAPERVLSVSGGGLLGVIPAAMLVRLEALGRQAYGADYRLCDSFSAVTGTSTGAVIAAGVALGLSAQDIANFYLRDVPQGFRRRALAVPLLHDLFDGDLMESFFERRTQGRLLERRALACDLTVVTKDLTRALPVAFTTIGAARGPILGAEIRREAQPLARLLRASTAAPGLFSPVAMTLEGHGPATLADGGFSLFNDPSYLAAHLALASGAGAVEMTVLGTGSSRPFYTSKTTRRGPAILRAARALFGLIKEGEALTEGLLADLARLPGGNVAVRRHDMRLTRDTFEALDMTVTRQELREMRRFADFRGKRMLFDAALALANRTLHDPLPLSKNAETTGAIDSPAPIGANYAQQERLFNG